MKVVTKCHRKQNNDPIPTVDFKRLSKYLGVYICIDGEVAQPTQEWNIDGEVAQTTQECNKQVEKLRKSHLTPLQKVEAIRQWQQKCYISLDNWLTVQRWQENQTG